MSDLYSAGSITSIDEMANSNAVFEMFLVQDALRGTSDQIHEFCESDAAKVLVEKAVLAKPTLMRLSKVDDKKRRTKMIAYQMAKEANDPEWKKLKKYTALRKQSIAKIMKKYGKKSERVANIAQKEYIKKSRSLKASPSEQKAAAAH